MSKLGREGEQWLAERLRQQGWSIRARNWRRPGIELDLVAQRRETLAFIEVKTRSRAPQDPLELLPYRKRLALQRGVASFLNQSESPQEAFTLRLFLAILIRRGSSFTVVWWPLEELVP